MHCSALQLVLLTGREWCRSFVSYLMGTRPTTWRRQTSDVSGFRILGRTNVENSSDSD
jgi:hypothetical protein